MESVEYKCPNCNADLKFNPITQKLECEYCESAFTIEEIKQICAATENSIPPHAVQAQQDFEAHTNLYHCKSCGAEIMADDQQTATFCYYCHNPVILSGKMSGSYKPSKIIGFRLTRENAENAFKKWIKGRKFVPTDFKSQQQIEKITGLYVPFWLADCNIDIDYRNEGRKSRSWTSGDYRYTETSIYRLIRSGTVVTQGIPADGESKIEDALMEAIEPYDYNELKDFSMSYLSGFFADKYDVDKASVFPRIRERASQACLDIIKESISGYSAIAPGGNNISFRSTDWHYILLPVWFMSYKYKGKVYEFAINGQTGKLAGTPPLSKGKLAAFCAAIGGIITILGTIGGGMMA